MPSNALADIPLYAPKSRWEGFYLRSFEEINSGHIDQVTDVWLDAVEPRVVVVNIKLVGESLQVNENQRR